MDSPASKMSSRTNSSLSDFGTVEKLSSHSGKTLSTPSHMSCDQKSAIASLSGLDIIENLLSRTDQTLPPPSPSPSMGRDKKNAISVLQKSSTDTGESVYDHLVDIIKKIIVERPKNVIDYFEDFSRRIRQERYRGDERTQRGFYQTTYRMDASSKILSGLVLNIDSFHLTNAFVNKSMVRLNHWCSAGIGFCHEKQIQLTLSMQRLLTNSILQDARFWGTIYGIEKNYYIAEATLTTSESESRISLAEDTLLEMELRETQTTLKSSIIGETPSNDELRTKIQDIIKSQHRPPDLNGQVYFVCTDFNLEWIELPSITPEEIVQSRNIQKLCRGNLEADVKSYPLFPGTEKSYLRALIARISHGTNVTPIKQPEEEPIENLVDVSNWIHTRAEINDDGSVGQIIESPIVMSDSSKPELSGSDRSSEQLLDENNEVIDGKRQSVAKETTSRVSTSVPNKNRLSTLDGTDKGRSDDASGNSETVSIVQSEIIIPKTCAEDFFDDKIRPWIICSVDNYCIPDAIIVASSAIWSGSFTLVTHKFVDHIYFGWGHKMTIKPIVPPIHFSTEDEYVMSDVESNKPKYE